MTAFQVNERAILARAVRHGGVVIAAGAKGVVVDIDPEEGVLFQLDRPHASLTTWHNMLPVDEQALSPYRSLVQRVFADRIAHPVILAGLIIMGIGIFTTHTDRQASAEHANVLLSPLPLSPTGPRSPRVPQEMRQMRAHPLPTAPTPIDLDNQNQSFGV